MTFDVVDAHMHLWSVTENAWYPALRRMASQLDRPDLFRDFGVPDYVEAAGGFTVGGFVHVSATTAGRAYLEEQRWVETLAERTGLNLVTIGTVDPALSSAEIVADLSAQAQSPRFRGVRVLYDFEPDSSAADTVLRWLDEGGYVFDLVTQPRGMTAWLTALKRYPDLTVVLEHCGWPRSTEAADRAQWNEAIRACAEQTNALCKISGLGMVTGDLSEQALRPWVEGAIDVFGWKRVSFGSNMPIEMMGGSYRQLVESFERIIGEASDADQKAFYADNARRFYKL
ncbi:amidohydrolase family protein [Rhodococcus qingshengii]|uniref:amidohydrolase family protein n=1 Tax=Rhodococcus qingshengii TaxID=334542 RepID=UPI0035D559BA